MKIKTSIALLALAFGLSACVSSNKKNADAENNSPNQKVDKRYQPQVGATVTRVIDYPSVQRLLNMDRNFTNLGFTEKIFDTCQVGFGYPSDTNCQKKYFTVIHFKLVCRESEGTISTVLTDDDLKPIAGVNVIWYLKSGNGSTVTDSDGYGQIITTASQSQKDQRLRLAVGSDFLMTKASEAKRLIAPLTWCNH